MVKKFGLFSDVSSSCGVNFKKIKLNLHVRRIHVSEKYSFSKAVWG